jgi:hemerythrin
MSTDPASYGAESAAGVDAEHQVQTGLVRALCDAVRLGRDLGQVREILDQLLQYSEVHFMSEQLLMRLCSYPDYDDHVLDHDRMTEMLSAVAARHGAGEQMLALREAQDMLAFLSRHIASRDQQFTAYYLDWSRRAADPRTGGPDP